MKSETNTSLVIKAKDGNETALNELLESQRNNIYAISYAILKNRTDTEEAVQQTFITVWKSIGSLKDVNSFENWLYRIAYTRSVNLFNSRNKQKIILDDDINSNPNIKYTDDEIMLPDVYVEDKYLKERIFKIINSLSALHKETILLHYFNEKSIKEISEIMFCSEGTVKSRLYFARNQIKSKIEKIEKKTGESFFGYAVCTISLKDIIKESVINSIPNLTPENGTSTPTTNNIGIKTSKILSKIGGASMKTKAILLTVVATTILTTTVIVTTACGNDNNANVVETVATEVITEKVTEKPTQKPTEKVTQKATEKPTEKPTKKATEKSTEKPTKKATEKPTEKATQKKSSSSSTNNQNNSNNTQTQTIVTDNVPTNNEVTQNNNNNNSSNNTPPVNVVTPEVQTNKPVVNKTTEPPKVWHEAVYKTVNHPAETKKVWVVDKAAYTYEEPVYETHDVTVCFLCGEVMEEDPGMHGLYHFNHGGKEEFVKFHYGNEWREVQVGTKTITVPEEGHWENKVVKEAWTEQVLVTPAGYY